MHPRTAFGITAGDRPWLAAMAADLEALGYEELWVNDTRRGDGLATLSTVAPATGMQLALGVAALSEQTPEVIGQRVERASIPPSRLTVGVGSGDSRSLLLVRDGVAALRRLLPAHQIAVAAVGPRMTRLAGEIADAVVANWALPERLAELREIVAAGAAGAGRSAPRLVAYVRTAVGPAAEDRLRTDMERYAAYGLHYARAFAEQRWAPIGVAVEAATPEAVASALQPYRSAADTVVVRGIPAMDTVDGWLEVARAASAVIGS